MFFLFNLSQLHFSLINRNNLMVHNTSHLKHTILSAPSKQHGKSKILTIVIFLLLLLGILGLFKSCQSNKINTASIGTDAASALTDAGSDIASTITDATDTAIAKDASDTAATDADADADADADNKVNVFGDTINDFYILKLANGTELNIPEYGFEDNFANAIRKKPYDANKFYVFDRLFFDVNSSSLNEKSQQQIQNTALILKSYPEITILLRGHTDNQGSLELNQALSLKRAESVKASLINLNINADRISVVGKAASEPVLSNETAEGRLRNRRIDLSITN